jgi:hypothetical protein
MSKNPGSNPWRRVLVYFGLAWPEGGEPRGKSRRSRYGGGFSLSSRLDEDIDDLRRRLEALERSAPE